MELQLGIEQVEVRLRQNRSICVHTYVSGRAWRLWFTELTACPRRPFVDGRVTHDSARRESIADQGLKSVRKIVSKCREGKASDTGALDKQEGSTNPSSPYLCKTNGVPTDRGGCAHGDG